MSPMPPIRRPPAEMSILIAVESGLNVLGTSGKAVVLHYLSGLGLSKEEIPHRVGLFLAALEQIFGSGSTLIELEIMKNIRRMEEQGESDATMAELVNDLIQGGT
jgi:hypothetical protein